MGYRVTAEVFDHSLQKGGKLLILLAIAEKASNDDGVAFGIDQGWPREERSARKKRETIAGKARLNPATVSRAIQELIGVDDELEVRWVRQGQARWAVYRIVVGDYRQRDVDVEFLERHGQLIDRPFSTPQELVLPWAARPGNKAETAQQVPDETSGTSEGDCLTGDQVEPDEMSGGHLTSTSGDTSYTRARGSKDPVQQQVQEDQLPRGRAGEEQQAEDGEQPAAAEPPASDREIADVVTSLRGADAGSRRTILPLAADLPGPVFRAVVATVRDRCRDGRVANPCGLLVSLLKIERAEQRGLAEAAFAAAVSRNAPRYAPAPWLAAELVNDAPELYVRQLAVYVDEVDLRARLEPIHPDRLDALLRLAADVRSGSVPASEPETPEQARCRWVADKAADPDFPLDELRAVVEAWGDVDDIERQTLLEQAETTRAAASEKQRAA